MARELIINATLPEVRIALMEDGEIQELHIDRGIESTIVGNIYKGKVTRVLPGMQAAFVDIGLEKAAFLYVDDVFVHPEPEDFFHEHRHENNHGGGEGGQSSDDTVDYDDEGREEADSGNDGANDEGSETRGQEASASESQNDNQSSQDFSGNANADENPNAGEQGSEGNSEGATQALPNASENSSDNENSWSESESEMEAIEDQMASEDFDDGEEEQSMDSQEGSDGSQNDQQNLGQSEQSENSEAGQDSENQLSENVDSQRGQMSFQRERGGRGRGGRGRFRGRGRGPRDRNDRNNRNFPKDRNAEGQEFNQNQNNNNEGQPAEFYGKLNENQDLQESDRWELSASGDQNNEQAGGSENAAPEGDRDSRYEGQRQLSESADQDGPRNRGPGGPRGRMKGGRQRNRPEFRQRRDQNRKIRPKGGLFNRHQAKIEDLLQEGNEVLVQVAKDPIAAKGARLTCHVSLPGRHLVCMPTVNHVGVSRRIESDFERRKLKDIVNRIRPRGIGFIVRTATAGQNQEQWLRHDIEYLSGLWKEIQDVASTVEAPAIVYQDLDSVLRSVRDWVNEDVDKIIVDSRDRFHDLKGFIDRFMPQMASKVDLYQGDIPVFDAYGISQDIHRALERRVWLKSGGYIVIDQAEALVAIDVNTGRYVGKKNLEDTILKTNLEAVKEIAYQLRLRNCGGVIILDLIDMEREENRHRVYRALEEELKKDRARPSIVKISELGLIEMTRKRTRDTMVRSLCVSCTHCEGKGYVKSKETVAFEILREIERLGIEKNSDRILVQAHPTVIDLLAIDQRDVITKIEKQFRKQVYLQESLDFHPEQYEVLGDVEPAKISGPWYNNQARRRSRPMQKRGTQQGRDQNRDSNRDNPGRDNRDLQRDFGQEREREEENFRPEPTTPYKDPAQSPFNIHAKKYQQQKLEAGTQTGSTNSGDPSLDGQAPNSAASLGDSSGEYFERQPTLKARADHPGNEEDGDFGNRVAPRDGSESNAATGNGDFGGERQGSRELRSEGFSPETRADGEEFNEEDRLAYLRAQAAQDAALAGFGSNNAGQSPSREYGARNNGAGRGPGGRGGRGRNRPGGGGGGRGRGRGGSGGGRGRRPGGPSRRPLAGGADGSSYREGRSFGSSSGSRYPVSRDRGNTGGFSGGDFDSGFGSGEGEE